MMNARGRGMRLSHVERFATIAPTGTALEVSSFSLNPGLPSIFPWLADVANRFEKYKFSSIAFRYIPQSAALAGLVTLAFDFDPNDDAPVTMAQATTYHDYVSTSIWHEATLRLDLASGDRLPQKNTRPGLPGGDIDLNVYDVGRLHVLTEGAAAGVVGYLEVMYTIDLMVHQVQESVGGKAMATADLDATHLVGSDETFDLQAVMPWTPTDTATFTFDQPFEGLIVGDITGTGLGGTPTNTGSATWSLHVTQVNAGTTRMVFISRVRASTGQTFIPSITATSVTNVTWRLARCDYASQAI